MAALHALRLLFITAALVLGTSGWARAQESERERDARAAFATGDYQKALDLYVRLYTDTPHPTYLRNIGRCYQNLGQPDRAIANFREYLRQTPDLASDQRTLVEGYMREMEALKQKGTESTPPPPRPVEQPTTTTTEAQPTTQQTGRTSAEAVGETATAPGSSGFYAQADLGFSFAGDPDLHIPEPLPASLGSSAVVGATLGYRLNHHLRTELALSYRPSFRQSSGSATIKSGSGSFSSLVGLVNVAVDLGGVTSPIRPFLGGGLGVARNSLGTVTVVNPDGTTALSIPGDSQASLAWRVGGGLSWTLTPGFVLGAAYHYLRGGAYHGGYLTTPGAMGLPATMSRDEALFQAHELTADARLSF